MKPETELLSDIKQNTGDTAKASAETAAAAKTTAETVVAATEAATKQGDSKPATIVTAAGAVVATPTTSEEQDRSSASQRAMTKIGEDTQRQLALIVIGAAILVASYLSVFGSEGVQSATFVFLSSAANLVIGFYFGQKMQTRIRGGG